MEERWEEKLGKGGETSHSQQTKTKKKEELTTRGRSVPMTGSHAAQRARKKAPKKKEKVGSEDPSVGFPTGGAGVDPQS